MIWLVKNCVRGIKQTLKRNENYLNYQELLVKGNLKQMNKSEEKRNRFSKKLMKLMPRFIWRKIVKKVLEYDRDGFAEKSKVTIKNWILEKSKQRFWRMWKILNSSINVPAFVYKTEFGLGFYLDILFRWTWELAETIIIIINAFIKKMVWFKTFFFDLALRNNTITEFFINKYQIMQ